MNELTKNEAYSLADFLNWSLIPYISGDDEVDSMEWLCNVVNAFQKLCEFSGYKWRSTDENNL